MKKTVILIKTLIFSFTVGATPFLVVKGQKKQNVELTVKDLPKKVTTSALGNFSADFNGKNISSEYLINHLGEWLGGNNDHTFNLINTSVDELGIKHSSYQHYYKNVKVADELILLHEKDGLLTFVNGEYTNDIDIPLGQILDKSEIESIVSKDMKLPNITFAEFENVITKVLSDRGVKLYSASTINALALKNLKGYTYYVDNASKNIVKKLEKIHHHNNINVVEASSLKTMKPLVDTPSTSATFYKGNQQITVDSYNGLYRLKDNARNIYTRDGTNWDGGGNTITGEFTGTITEYTSATPNFTANDTKPPVEVHWAMSKAHDYYVSRHNRNSYDGNGSIIRNYYNVNFAPANQPASGINAAAVDIQGIVGMVYGNGTYQGMSGYFNPFVALDVAGHEYSHLIVSRTANLAYQGESGALNESFADIFGASIEFYTNISPNWTIGEGIPNPALGFTFLRSMSNPNSGPAILGSQQPDTYPTNPTVSGSTQYWASTIPTYNANGQTTNDHGGVHTNSGVGNYWFYLLSAGGSGINDIGNNFNVTGITIQKAEKIAYRTLANYLTANSQFIDAYNASKQAVTDLYGATGNEQLQNVKAWYAVGIGNGLLSTSEIKNKIENQLAVYPNPVKNGIFTIENNSSEGIYEIYDASGKLIKNSDKLLKGNNKINVTGVEKGVYFVKINIEGSIVSKKIVIEK
ncbi:M4 family metallopeptidase [Chryseobacterium sp.]|uniref:M4 family metallopeptidase n=1 Tax=Chryseobacterium sp. TaxID=1871047 RepID=UPI0028A10255|nr:M4 family metallopeptidase [Chryseobacterium sp.]